MPVHVPPKWHRDPELRWQGFQYWEMRKTTRTYDMFSRPYTEMPHQFCPIFEERSPHHFGGEKLLLGNGDLVFSESTFK